MGKNRYCRSKAQAIFHKARTEPSPTCFDPRQISLFDYEVIKARAKAFAKPDRTLRRR